MRSRTTIAAVTVLLSLVLLLGMAPQQDQELRARLRQAVQRLQQGDALGALLDLERLLELDEDSWEAYYYRGRAQTQLGDDLGAHASFQEAASLNPGDEELHFLVASAAYALADFPTAWEQSIRAIQAGYERSAFDAMFKAMRRYSRQPQDFDARVAAPRLIVDIAPGDQAAGDVPEAESTIELQELSLALRRALMTAPRVALVNDIRRARYVVELGVADDGSLEARLLAVGSDEPIERWAVPDAVIPEMSAEELTGELEDWLGTHGQAG